jgi:hypothetical protein
MRRALQRLADVSWLPLSCSAASLLAPRAAPALLPLALALFIAAPFFLRHRETPRWLARIALLLFLFACGWTVYHQPGAPLDLFEDGVLLSPAQTYAMGGRPYIDTYPLHGWGADGGLDAFVFRVFGPTLETFRLRRAALTALGLPLLAAASFLLLGDSLWAGIGLLLSLSFCPFLSERQIPALLVLCLLLRAARTRRPADWIFSGALAGVTLFFSFDFGVIVLLGGLVAAILLPVLECGWCWRPPVRGGLCFLGGAAAGAFPLLLRLAQHGAVRAFFLVSFVEIPATIIDTWGLPVDSASAIAAESGAVRFLLLLATGHEMPSLFLLLLLASGGTILLFRAAHRSLEPLDFAAAASIAVAAVALRGALGRADAGHLALYGVLAGPPAAWILYRAAHARRHRILLTGIVLATLLARLEPHRALTVQWNAIAGATGTRAAAAFDPHVPKSGRATLPAGEARELAALKQVFDSMPPGQTFFDFANEPALYFLFDRKSPVRYCCVPFYETEEKQLEVIAALERVRPPLAILAGGTPRDAFDGISNRERVPRVAAYLDTHYEPYTEVFGRRIARRRGP